MINQNNKSQQYSDQEQLLIINMLLSDPDAFAICRSIIKDSFFADSLRPAMKFIMEYADQYRIMPSVELVQAKSGVNVEKFSEDDKHTEFLKKEVETFCRAKAVEQAIFNSAELYTKGAYGEIQEQLKEAMTISLMSDLGTEYYEDPESRLRRMLDRSSYISTGWETLDYKLFGGFIKGGLNIFAAGSGVGKSIFLQNLAVNWSLMGKTVLYISLELSEDLICQRIDAMQTGRTTTEIIKNISETVMMIRNVQRKHRPGQIFFKKLPEGGTTCNTIRAYVKEFEIKHGKKPDALLIDYLDLMYPINQKIDVSNLFVKDKFVSEEIRGLMHELDCFGATASQLGRSSVESAEYDHSHIAGGISKINTADNVFGIYSTAAMKEKGLMQLQFMKTRSAAAVGQKLDLAYDPGSMRLTDAAITENVNSGFSKDSMKTKASVPAANSEEKDETTGKLSRLANKARTF